MQGLRATLLLPMAYAFLYFCVTEKSNGGRVEEKWTESTLNFRVHVSWQNDHSDTPVSSRA